MGHEDALSRLISIIAQKPYREKAVKVFKNALNGDIVAMFRLINAYDSLEINSDKWRYRALVACQKQVELGDDVKQYVMERLIGRKKGGYIDDFIDWCVNLANSGNIKIMNVLADYYDSIDDINQLIFWKNRAADAGDLYAVYRLISLYGANLRVSRDYSKLFELYKKAIELENAQYYYSLGMLYKQGEEVAQDYVKARECFELVVEKGT